MITHIFEVEYWQYNDVHRVYFSSLENAAAFAAAFNLENPLGVDDDHASLCKIEVHKLWTPADTARRFDKAIKAAAKKEAAK